jgi:type I restriction enzyme R subunit
VREFFDKSLKEPGGNLPGKSILFAMSHAHAKRLWETFNEEYPQFPGLAEIIDSHMEDPESLLKRFKTEDLPRIAISVDMLDTGVDVPTVTNLGLLKPVFPRIRFWQMIGRGTRRVDEATARAWCPAGSKDSFRVIDFWETFERFQIDPDGVVPAQSTPAATRLFRLLLQASRAIEPTRPELAARWIAQARGLIAQLPVESAGVREHRHLVDDITADLFWESLTPAKYQLLTLEVAPLMRFLPGVDLEAASFQSRILEFALAQATNDTSKAQSHAERLREAIARLPAAHPDVAPHAALVSKLRQPAWSASATMDEIDALESLATLMRHRVREGQHIITLDLEDALQEQKWIVVGPDATEFDPETYRDEVETRVRTLGDSHPAILKLTTGQPLAEGDIAAIEEVLDAPELYITTESLQKVYDAPHGTLLQLLKHALGVEALQPREDAIKVAFESFVADHGYLEAEQILFVRLFAARLIQAGRVVKSDLHEQPFTLLTTTPEAQIPEPDLEALFDLAGTYERR